MTPDAHRLLQQATGALRGASSEAERLKAYRKGTRSLTAALNDGMATGELSQEEATRLWRAWTDKATQALPNIETVHHGVTTSRTIRAEHED